MTWLPFVVIFLAWVGGGIVSIVTGFGCGLFALPIMLLCISPEQAIPVNCALCCVAMALILLGFWRQVDLRHFAFLSVVGLPGVVLGVYALETLPIRWIEFGFGVFLLCCVGWELVRSRVLRSARPVRGMGLEALFGLLAGFINGLIGLGGPALGVYAAIAHWDKDMARGTFGLFFGINLAIGTALQFRWGLMGAAEIPLIAWAVPGAVVGTLLGIPLARRISQRGFVRLLLALIAVSGIVVIKKSLG